MSTIITRPAPPRREGVRTHRPPQYRIAIWVPLVGVLLLALGLIFGIWRHVQKEREREEFAEKTEGTTVEFTVAARNSKARDLVLPGNITAGQETTVYARASGYVARWLVDIGDVVKEGQPLAILATPEVDQQLAQARQEQQQAQANFELARVSAQRWRQLVEKNVVSKQENDERQSQYGQATGAVNAAAANVERLAETQGFKNVTAPYAGKITSRRIDVGSLVSAGSGTAGTPLFTISQDDPLDIFVNVPQTNVPSIFNGMEVRLLVVEYPDRDFQGKVIRTAGALDPASRTLLTEVEIPNHDHALFAGMYAQIKFTLQDNHTPVIIPANAFVFKVEGPQVVTLTQDNKVHWQSITVGRDYGKEMEATSGVEENVRLVLNPTDDLKEGMQVQAKPAETPSEAEKK